MHTTRSNRSRMSSQLAIESFTGTIPSEVTCWLDDTLAAFPASVEIQIDFWGQQTYTKTSKTVGSRVITLKILHPGVVRDLVVSRDPLIIIEFLIDGKLTVDGEFDDIVELYCFLADKKRKASESLYQWCENLPRLLSSHPESFSPLAPTTPSPSSWQNLPLNSTDRNKAAVQYHYDVSNDFYKLWLDPLMLYSCAHFEREDMTLAEAQEAKLDAICRKLRLQPGDSFLDIGCGWGGLLRWAATKYGVKAHGITLSEEQLAHNLNWIDEQGLGSNITVELADYRTLPSETKFDKIASVGMIEHVGLVNYQTYFKQVLRALQPGGLFLNHGISLNRIWLPEVQFILRYIFPDAQCPPIATYLQSAVTAGWEIVDLDSWRPHYAKTLRCWAANLESRLPDAKAIVGDRIIIWQLYLTMCAQGFENGSSGVYQMLLRNAADSEWNLPLTRDGWLA